MTDKLTYFQNRQLHYRVAGSGSPVILLHGFAEDGDVWRYQQEELSNHYQLILPDLPGSGKSEMIADMSMEGLAEAIRHLLLQEVPDGAPVTMIGHSMGGYIALAFAEKHPHLLQGLGLFHSTAFADNEEKKATRRRGITFIQTHGSNEFIKQSAPNLFAEAYRIKNNGILAEMIARYSSFDPQALTAYYQAMIQRPDRTTLLQSFIKPVLFIVGKHDKAIPFEDSMKQCHIPPIADVHILEEAAHMGMWEEKEKSGRALLSYLNHTAVNRY